MICQWFRFNGHRDCFATYHDVLVTGAGCAVCREKGLEEQRELAARLPLGDRVVPWRHAR